MIGDRERLAQPRLSAISTEPDPDLARLAATIIGSVRIAGPDALAAWLARLVATGAPVAPRTLDLFGHSTGERLRLGDWVIDGDDPGVRAFFREQRAPLAALGVHAVRLLACNTAGSAAARQTLRALAEATGVEVYGATQLLYDAHHDARGFLDAWAFLLVGAHEQAAPPREPAAHALELGILPARPLQALDAATRIATPDATRAVLALLDQAAGARLAGELAGISLALAARPGSYCLADVVLDGTFVRFEPGIAYPVRDPAALRRLVAALPQSSSTQRIPRSN